MSLPKHHERSSLMRSIKTIKQHFHNCLIVFIMKNNTCLCQPTEQTRGCRHGDGVCQKPCHRSINVLDFSMVSCCSNWNNPLECSYCFHSPTWQACHRLLMTWSRLSTHDVHLDVTLFVACMRISALFSKGSMQGAGFFVSLFSFILSDEVQELHMKLWAKHLAFSFHQSNRILFGIWHILKYLNKENPNLKRWDVLNEPTKLDLYPQCDRLQVTNL